MSKGGKSKNKKEPKADSFVWSDDEVELLLKITSDYKISKSMENVDWQSLQTKYSDILDLFKEQYPSKEDAEKIGKDYPHNKDDLTKAILTTKIKNIRAKYRQAVDSGRRSGHGRVVLLYFELCERIWGGSPATKALSNGLESTEVNTDNQQSPEDYTASPGTVDFDSGSVSSPESPSEASTDSTAVPSTSERRNLLDAKLKGYKHEKLKRKPSPESQLLDIAQQEFQIKKQLLERIDNMDKAHANHMDRLTSNLERLTGSIADGFGMLRQMMVHSAHVPQMPQYMPSTMGYSTGYHGHSAVRASPLNTTMSDTSGHSSFSYTQQLYSDDS